MRTPVGAWGSYGRYGVLRLRGTILWAISLRSARQSGSGAARLPTADERRCRSTLRVMTTTTLNSLAHASSAYLRSAMHQPIQWHEWGEEAFAAAQRENKPTLLDIGAVWRQWGHCMNRESYDSPEIAEIINQRFIAVKVDRDERPDIDSRYQIAVSSIRGQV